MAHSYKSEYPQGVQVDDGIKAFFEEFYKTSDTTDAHEKYADSFTKDATIIVASKKAVGSEGMKSMFSYRNSLSHIPTRNPKTQKRHVDDNCFETTHSPQDLPIWFWFQ